MNDKTSTHASPPLLCTDLKACGTSLGILALGVVLAILLGGSVTWLYWAKVIGPALIGAVQDYGDEIRNPGVLIFLLVSMPTQLIGALLVGVLLPFFTLAYGALGFFYAWRLALRKIVVTYGTVIAARLAGVITDRLSILPRTQETLTHARQWLSGEGIASALESLLGKGVWSRRVAYFAARRLPWSELLADWATHEQAQQTPEQDENFRASFRDLLTRRLAAALQDAATPPKWPLVAGVLTHAALFGLGTWLAG
ncbi:MAG: hypothetical protein LBS89_05570 [Zoogloeaceae bacterium]|jgi:hypothetical protein|nr:hypothetical protein [Zoogloeaceae bacterium]